MYKVYLQSFWNDIDPVEFCKDTLGDLFVYVDNPSAADVVMTSVFGPITHFPGRLNVHLSWESAHMKYPCDAAFISEEPTATNHIWCPLLISEEEGNYIPVEKTSSFASCIITNTWFTDGARRRYEFLKAFVERYKDKDILIGGANDLANFSIPKGEQYKLEWMKAHPCLFNICPENVFKKGYITEKIRDAYLTKHIPIYWGDTEGYEQYVPDGSYIRINMDDYEETFREIDAVVESEEKQRRILAASPLPYAKSGQQIIRETILELLAKKKK